MSFGLFISLLRHRYGIAAIQFQTNNFILLNMFITIFHHFIKGVCDLALSFGEGSDGDKDKRMSRPFGVALLIAGHDDLNGHQLFFSDPSGTFVQYKAKAIGAGSEGAQSTLAESYNEDMTLEEAEELALSTLKQVMEEKISTENVELARVTETKGYHSATAEEVGAVLERL